MVDSRPLPLPWSPAAGLPAPLPAVRLVAAEPGLLLGSQPRGIRQAWPRLGLTEHVREAAYDSLQGAKAAPFP